MVIQKLLEDYIMVNRMITYVTNIITLYYIDSIMLATQIHCFHF